ncbi:MAG: hypothetical protein JSS29_17220 [Proteobacteria bacterium]|nr:hypothetical protein [Pseudomonadota bacterium]
MRYVSWVVAGALALSGLNACKSGADGVRALFPNEPAASVARAIPSGDVGPLKSAVAGGLDVNMRGRYGATFLMWAVTEQSRPAVEFLLAHGADPNLQFQSEEDPNLPDILRGASAIEIATRLKDPWFLETLARHGADINLPNGQGHYPPVCAAITSLRTENARLLISMGAQLNGQDILGFTPLASAITANRFDLAYEMLEQGADPTIKLNRKGSTVLTFIRRMPIPTDAQGEWRSKVIELLRSRGLDTESGL